MAKEYFFTVCSCGSKDWIEWVKDSNGKSISRVNGLNSDGEMRFPWKINIHLYENVNMNMNSNMSKQNLRRYFSYDYEDLICLDCEKRLHPIPFSDIDKKQRISIYKMPDSDRIDFANSYKLLKVFEK